MKIISNKEYHDKKNVLSASLAKVLLQNAKKYKMIVDGELKERTKAMDFGSALHLLVLEGESAFWENVIVTDVIITKEIKQAYESGVRVCVYPNECLTASGSVARSKKAVEIIEGLDKDTYWVTPKKMEEYNLLKQYEGGKIILNSSEFELLEKMRDKVLEIDRFAEFLAKGRVERSFFCEYDGVELRCRPDLIVKTRNGVIVVDLKTMAGEATPDEFAKATANYLYYLQEAIYKKVLELNGYRVVKFLFAGVSKVEHSGAAWFEHDYIAVERGEELLDKVIFKLKWCRERNIWSENKFDFANGGFEKINTITLPAYAFYQFE